MRQLSAIQAIEPQWLLLIALVMAAAMLFLSAHLSGWSGLARHHKVTTSIEGERFRFATARMGRSPNIGGVSYRNCLCITVGNRRISRGWRPVWLSAPAPPLDSDRIGDGGTSPPCALHGDFSAW